MEDQASKSNFRGYMPECGAPFLREMITAYYENENGGVSLSLDEVFISSEVSHEPGDILDLFERSGSALGIESVYPTYVDANVMAGRKIVRVW